MKWSQLYSSASASPDRSVLSKPCFALNSYSSSCLFFNAIQGRVPSWEVIGSPDRTFVIKMVRSVSRFFVRYHSSATSVVAAMTVANIVKSSLGPLGLDKMLVDNIGVRFMPFSRIFTI
jgi:hypothetical protein